MTDAFNEMYDAGALRAPYRALETWRRTMPEELRQLKQTEAEALFRRFGITFAVYGEGGDPDRLMPFDMFPRVFTASEWRRLERGIKQRARALNAFLADIYDRAEILRAGRIPAGIVRCNEAYEIAVAGVRPPLGVYSHVVGIDIVRTGPDQFHVLEDNCRTPSGVSYMLENREIMMRMFPELFAGSRVEPVDGYADQLRATLEEMAPRHCRRAPVCVVLTPGPFNAAYYEHSYLADQMGAELVEARDLFVDEAKLWMKTTQGPTRVDVVYRRIDDDFLDPLVFRPDSYLGVPGLMDAYRAGNVTLVSAPGTGVADDKAVYCYVPEMIRFYLGETAILENVPTWQCAIPEHRDHVLTHLDELVVKEVHGSGGYGMLIGPRATAQEREDFARKIAAEPAAFIAQPTLALSTVPTVTPRGIASRHVDFRPFCLVGRDVRLTPGGLTRVALKEGSLVVNSSQGGGVKDTWVLSE